VDTVADFIRNTRPGMSGALSLQHDSNAATALLAVFYLNEITNAKLTPMSVAECIGDSYPYRPVALQPAPAPASALAPASITPNPSITREITILLTSTISTTIVATVPQISDLSQRNGEKGVAGSVIAGGLFLAALM
jgi:hypothetical protein